MTSQTDSNTSNKVPTQPRIIIQHDWSANLKSNTSVADVWLEFKSGNVSISRFSQNIHGVCSLKALANDDAKVYKTLSSENFESGDIDKKRQQLCIKIRDTQFSHTFQGKQIFFVELIYLTKENSECKL
jgi:hypothetical protein